MNSLFHFLIAASFAIFGLLTFGYRAGRSRAKEKADNQTIKDDKQEEKQNQKALKDDAQDFSKNDLLSELDHGTF